MLFFGVKLGFVCALGRWIFNFCNNLFNLQQNTLMKSILCFFSVAILWGCGSSSKMPSTKLADDADLSIYKTFGFFEIDTLGLINPTNYVANIETLKQAVRKQMSAFGYVESATPDLKVNMGIVIEEKAQTRETDFRTDRPQYMGQRNYSWQSEEIVVGYYREGTLDFHLVDAKANKMVWRATAKDVLPDKQKNMAATIDRNVARLFEKFPGKAT